MNILVCVKKVNGEINPFDASALECALQFKNATVTVLSMGRPDVRDLLYQLTRLGVFRAILLTDKAFAGADTLATAYTLSMAVRKLKPDIILCGRQSVDGDTAQVGPCMAALLGIPVITEVLAAYIKDNGNIKCRTRYQEIEVTKPALLTIERSYKLRFPSFRAKAVEPEIWDSDTILADKKRCGFNGSPTLVVSTYNNTLGKRHCKFIDAKKLSEVLTEVEKKIRNDKALLPINEKKFDEVWAVGEKVIPAAYSVAEKVKVIKKQPPEVIAELAIKEKPKVILWDTSSWGRCNAPQVAAFLKTGLCADCTLLETNGEKLFMIRPALGGNIMARIVCKTLPQMATVRTIEKTDNKLLAVGGGAKLALPLIFNWAKKNNFLVVGSRTAVDKSFIPYESQVGLTGKTVNPNIYLAFGISGAVQHTCGIEQANTIIAVNTDPDARIFEYADYGIIDSCENVLNIL